MMTAIISPESVYGIATMDTKGEEILYVAERVLAVGAKVTVVNVGTLGANEKGAHVSREAIASCHPQGRDAVFSQTDRGQAIAAMSEALTVFLKREHSAGRMSGVI